MCGTRDMFFELFRFEIGHGLRRNWIWILEGVTVPIYSSLELSMINSVIAYLSCGNHSHSNSRIYLILGKR